MKFIKFSSFAIIFSLILTSCGSGGPTSKDDLKKLKSYNSYAFLPNKDTIISRNFDNDAIQEVIINTINANLKEEGFILNKRNPDILVHFHPMFDEQIAVNANPVYTNYAYYRPGHYVGPYYRDIMYDNYFTVQRLNGPRVKQVPYLERTIVIDLIDRRTNEILWRGRSDEKIETKRIDRAIRENIDDIFKDHF
ncbi:DUF4136 domain-containing protein [Christiangramia sabulilitoris]|uniref:DUF4136 domain-containing protein n=1 Tax=Christiangramia sabulilitoris TaxID=2583991 RepID=A0A550I304_9FLAO|nr:DUF4136 domain-containing protein [Christiangramia sabulilitoris]TRO65370.1 DUF4136 domain-containing protein [Christiangramia sabulilitoris]